MKVLMVEPGIAPYEKELEGLKQMQAAVGGGLIEPIYPYQEKVAIVCNEEGILRGMDFNRSVPGGYGGVFGPFFICGLTDDDFCSLTPEQMEKFKKEFHKAELLVDVRGNEPITMKVEPRTKEAVNHEVERKKPVQGQER